MTKIGNYLHWISKHKYLWTILLFLLIIGVVDSNSFLYRYSIYKKNQLLKEQIDSYNQQYKSDQKTLNRLKQNPSDIEEIARIKLFMKSDNEDIYVIEEKSI